MDNFIVNLTEDNIKYKFKYEGHTYALIGDADEHASDGNAYLVELVEGEDGVIVRGIDSDKLYEKVKKEFERKMEELESLVGGIE